MPYMKKSALNASSAACALAAVIFMSPLSVRAECSVTTSSETVDYGLLNTSMTAGSLGRWVLAPRSVQVMVDCDDPQVMSLSFSDDSNAKDFSFGRAGQLKVSLSGLYMDNRATEFMDFSESNNSKGRRQQIAALRPDSLIVTTDKGQHLTFTLTLRPAFTSRLLSVQDDTQVNNEVKVTVNE